MRVAIVAGIIIDHDAISASVAGQASILERIPTVEKVVVFAQHINRDLPCESFELHDAWSLTRHPAFALCDVVIFHWGIHYQLFDVITLLSTTPSQRPVVHFHNCTPREFVAESDRDLIDRSIAQVEHVISLGVHFWTFSEFNRRTLIAWGTPVSQIHFVPIPVEIPSFVPAVRAADAVNLLMVGRRVPAKGIHVMLEALGRLDEDVRSQIQLRIAGSSTFTAPGYIESLESLVDAHDLRSLVEFVDEPTDEELWHLYCGSDVVVSCSFHEGLCVPVLEGYAVGCRAIGTTAGNLPFVVQEPDPCVEPGDPGALAAVIVTMVAEVRGATAREQLHPEFIAQYSRANTAVCLQRELYRAMSSDRR